MTRVRKADSNQKELVSQMRKIPGLTVAHIHTVGQGVPDLICGFRQRNYLFELKDPKKPPSAKKLTEDEKLWHEQWTGSVHVVETLDDVLKIIGL